MVAPFNRAVRCLVSMDRPMTAQPFWDRMAPKYARKPVDDPDAYHEKLALVASLLRPKDSVLEIGCGTGTTALRLAPHVAQYTATDGSRAMIGLAGAKLGPDAPENVTFHHADAAEQVAGAPFDAICAFSLLHLVEDVPPNRRRGVSATKAAMRASRSGPVPSIGSHISGSGWRRDGSSCSECSTLAQRNRARPTSCGCARRPWTTHKLPRPGHPRGPSGTRY